MIMTLSENHLEPRGPTTGGTRRRSACTACDFAVGRASDIVGRLT